MKIMVVTTRLPLLSGKPDSFTVFKLIEYLSKRHSIVLVSAYEDKSELEGLTELNKYCDKVFVYKNPKYLGYLKILLNLFNLLPFQINYFYSKKMKSLVNSSYDDYQPDIVYTHLIRSAEFTKHLKCTKIIAYQISHSLNYQRLIFHKKRGLIRFIYSLEHKFVNQYEKNIASYYDKILFIGMTDYKSIFPNNENLEKLFISPHGVDLEYFSPKNLPKTNNIILFPADFSPETNKEAGEWFCEHVYPILLTRIPNIRVIFAGRNPSKTLIKFGNKHKNFIVTGYVKDIRDYYEIADILINPVRACAGQQNKILTGMSMGLPVVSTYEANEGIGAEGNNHILLSEGTNAQKFTDNIVLLLNNSTLKKMIAQNGYNFVHSNWSWEVHFKKLEVSVFNLLHIEEE